MWRIRPWSRSEAHSSISGRQYKYQFELSDTSFHNILWKVSNRRLQTVADKPTLFPINIHTLGRSRVWDEATESIRWRSMQIGVWEGLSLILQYLQYGMVQWSRQVWICQAVGCSRLKNCMCLLCKNYVHCRYNALKKSWDLRSLEIPHLSK